MFSTSHGFHHSCGVNHDGGAIDFDGVGVEGDARSDLTLGLATGTKSESQ